MAGTIKLIDFFRHYKEGEPHQMAAIEELQRSMPQSLLQADTPWVEIYRATPRSKDVRSPNTWEGVMGAAAKAGARYPELVAAQWALESGWGQHTSGKHNYFGLKGPGTTKQTREVVNGKTITIAAEFLNFDSLDSCVAYLVDRWHRDWRDYKGVNHAPNREEAACGLIAQGYATDPEYAKKLIKLMHEKAPKAAAKQQEPPRFAPGAPFSTMVTPHISYGELTLNDERRRFTNQGQCDIATELCVFLEKVRAQFGGKPVVITSGHRPPAVNSSVGGASDSEHLYKPGCGAVDFWVKGADIYAVQDWCDKNWPYSVGYGAKKGFVHLGIRARRPRVRWDY